MCILLSTTAHPDYPLIILSNRDEYLVRPTKLAEYRPLDNGNKILSPLDMGRPEHGTWIGVSTDGKIAVLVNYREVDMRHSISKISRGVLPISYLSTSQLDEGWYNSMDSTEFEKIGGFSLLYGKIRMNPATGKINHLNILSNRGDPGKVFSNNIPVDDLHYEIGRKTTFGLSNSLYYQPWHKVQLGEILLHEAISDYSKFQWNEEKLVEECFGILSHDTYDEEVKNSGDWNAKLAELKNSIFIPPLNTDLEKNQSSHVMGNYYGTRTQVVILVDKVGNLNYYERDLHNGDCEELNIRKNHFKFKFDLYGKTSKL